MQFKEKIEDDIVILSLKGNIMGGPDTQKLHEHIKFLIGKGHKKFVIDLGQVKWLNSSGIGMLMASYSSISNDKGSLILSRVTKKIRSLLIMTKILTFFQTTDSIDDAVASLK